MKVGKVAVGLLLALELVSSAGCARRRPVLGRDIAVERVRQIVPRVTTETQIEQWFGPPDLSETKADGSKDHLYKYDGYVDSGLDLLVVAWKTKKPETKRLRINVLKGLVTRVTYTNSAQPSEDLTK